VTSHATTSATVATNVPSAVSTSGPAAGPPPHVQLIQMAVAIWEARAVYAAAQLGLADLLADRSRTCEDLAKATLAHPSALRRLLRALASCGVVTEVEPGRFALTPLGAALRSDAPGAARATVLTLAGDWQWTAWGKFLYSLQTGKPALGAAYGMGLFEYLAAHPEDGAHFNEAMVGMYAPVGPAVVAAYDFSAFRTVVDLGGGTGGLLRTILRTNESLHGTLFELPGPASQARRSLEASGLSSRCTVLEGDFFKGVPAAHDAYVLAHVLHDWPDEKALPILRNCRQAIRDNGRLLIVEAVLPPGDTPHLGKLMDLLMLTVTGGVERTTNEFADLLAAADFKLTRVVPTSTHQSVVEAVPVASSLSTSGKFGS
jgi:SAM-dependent methyltransferase